MAPDHAAPRTHCGSTVGAGRLDMSRLVLLRPFNPAPIFSLGGAGLIDSA